MASGQAASSVGGRASEERNGSVLSLMRTVKGLQKCSMKAGQTLFSLFARSPARATLDFAARRSNIVLATARILEQKRDCWQFRWVGVFSLFVCLFVCLFVLVHVYKSTPLDFETVHDISRQFCVGGQRVLMNKIVVV